jgi:hypothetical protein
MGFFGIDIEFRLGGVLNARWNYTGLYRMQKT